MKVIIFDMDGTLINSAKAIYCTINALRRNIGLKENLKEDFIIKTINDPKKDMIFEFYGVRNVTKEQKYEFEREFIKNYKLHAKLYDGLFEILQKCRDEGYFIAVASNAPEISLREILKINGVSEFFDLIVGVDKNMPPKPDPAMLFKVLEISGAKLNEAIFLGDSKKDEIAAIKAKMPYIQATWGFGQKSEISQNAKTPGDAWKIIQKM